jgi:hypothetical protein
VPPNWWSWPARHQPPGLRLARQTPRPPRRRPGPVRHLRVPARPHRPARRRGRTVLRRGARQRARQPRPGHRHAAVTGDIRPDRHALLELDALLAEIAILRDEGDAARSGQDARYRWVCTGGGSPPATRPRRPGPTYMTCATISRTPGSPTSTKHSSAASPGPASAPLRQTVQDQLRRSQPGQATCPEPATLHAVLAVITSYRRRPPCSRNVTADGVTATRTDNIRLDLYRAVPSALPSVSHEKERYGATA